MAPERSAAKKIYKNLKRFGEKGSPPLLTFPAARSSPALEHGDTKPVCKKKKKSQKLTIQTAVFTLLVPTHIIPKHGAGTPPSLLQEWDQHHAVSHAHPGSLAVPLGLTKALGPPRSPLLLISEAGSRAWALWQPGHGAACRVLAQHPRLSFPPLISLSCPLRRPEGEPLSQLER